MSPSLYDHAVAHSRQHPGDSPVGPPPRPADGPPPPGRRFSSSPHCVPRIVAAVARAAAAAEPEAAVLSSLDLMVRRLNWYDHGSALTESLRHLPAPRDRLHRLGRRYAMRGEHPNAVRLGLALLGGFGSERDEDLFRLFGTDPIFCLATAEALSRCHPAAERALFALADRSTGWSRVTMVETLTGSTDPEIDPEIKEWLIRDACTGDVLDSYFVLAAARTGDLAGVLSRPTLDEQTLGGAGRMLVALSDVDGPGASLSSYEGAPRALAHYLRHRTAGATTVQALLQLISINRYFEGARAAWLDEHDLTEVAARYAGVIGTPESRRLVTEALASPDPSAFHAAIWSARALGLPLRETLLRRVETEPLNSTYWYLLIDDCPADAIGQVVAAAERLLPLGELRSGPTLATGVGREYAVDQCLDLIVCRLPAHPGHGIPLLETALQNRTARNRRMAAGALAAWPPGSVPPSARAVLRRAAAVEPVDDVRERMLGVLARPGP